MTTLTKLITGQECLFDLEVYEKYKHCGLSVCTKPDGYKTLVFTSGELKTKYYCRVITGAVLPQEVDHINGNTLDNRLSNLRLATSTQNKYNQKKKGNSTLPKGVTKHGSGYKAAITKNYKTIVLGTFRTPEEAGNAYKDAAEIIQAEFAAHNSRI